LPARWVALAVELAPLVRLLVVLLLLAAVASAVDHLQLQERLEHPRQSEQGIVQQRIRIQRRTPERIRLLAHSN
jgi:hypothetical protein